MTLLFDPGRSENGPSARSVLWTWLVWLPIALACFHVAWGYGSAGAEGAASSLAIGVSLGLVGVGTLARAAARTRQWLRRRT
jgi:hypothetical protein